MKVYFVASIRNGKRFYLKHYKAIVATLEKLGCEVETCDVFVEGIEDRVTKMSEKDLTEAHSRLLRRLKTADVVVVEVSVQSTSVGYEITEALFFEKPVIALYTNSSSIPLLLEGRNDERIQFLEYNLSNLPMVLEKAIDEAKRMLNIRFNFFIDSEILQFLDRIAKKQGISRSGYIRDLIKREMLNYKQEDL